ncbi:MAG: hypothetical protein IJP24_06515 [Firmicutes bacterium]|nr:hypothetical protein [Bacillota bacterium]MBQ9973164.1 hypothetical protein [Bacillota bacterium]
MNYKELLEYLDLDTPLDFQYFENLADIIECEDEIEDESLEKLFAGVDSEILAEVLENYFTELTDKVPQKSVDIYTLIENIGRALKGLAKSLDDDIEGANVSLFAEELSRFRKWYMFDTEVTCRNIKTGKEEIVPVAEAISLYRLESLDGDEYDYDFESALEYELEEFVMSFATLAAAEYDESDDYEHNHDHEHEHEHHEHWHDHDHKFDSSILDDGFVYDDEFDKDL